MTFSINGSRYGVSMMRIIIILSGLYSTVKRHLELLLYEQTSGLDHLSPQIFTTIFLFTLWSLAQNPEKQNLKMSFLCIFGWIVKPVHKRWFLPLLSPSYHFRCNMQMFPRNFVLSQKCFLICRSKGEKLKTNDNVQITIRQHNFRARE